MSSIDPIAPTAPIPGANYTSDTKNYPWHRPPDITDLDGAIEHIFTRLVETDAGKRYMSLIEVGTTITTITDIVVTLAVGRGKITPDYALLIAGPVARLLEIMAKSYKIPYDLGVERVDEYVSSAALIGLAEIEAGVEEEVEIEDVPTEEEPQGFMSAVSEEEQANMLGYDVEEVEQYESGI